MTSSDVAFKFFEVQHDIFLNDGILPKNIDILRVFRFLKQCREDNLKLIGINYEVYVGDIPYKHLKVGQIYTNGFAVAEKETRKVIFEKVT